MASFLVNMAINQIKNGLREHAKDNNAADTDLYLMIYPKDANMNPGFRICKRTQPIRDINFAELVNMKSFMGYNIGSEGEKWVKKFLIKSAKENNISSTHFYFVRILPNDNLQAYMYVNDNPTKEVPLDYILQTE